jgi:membrane protein
MLRVFEVIGESANRWVDDRCYRLGASLAFWALFSIFPLLLLFVTVVGFFVGHDPSLRAQLVDLVGGGSSPEARVLIDQTLGSMRRHQTAGGISAVIGGLTLLFGASGVFGELESALNLIWRVPPRPTKKWSAVLVEAVRDQATSFLLVVIAGIVLLASLVASTALGTLDRSARSLLHSVWLWQLLEMALSIGFLTLLFAAIFRMVPQTRVAWGDVLSGALLTAIAFALMKRLLALYLARLTGYAAYGAVGAVLALLTWIYVLSLLTFFGAEMTRVYAERFGSLSKRSLEPQRDHVDDRRREPGAPPERHSLT